MKLRLTAAALYTTAAFLVTTTAQAEGYAELRGGIAGTSGYSTESIGLALGYDGDIGSNVFLGGEFTADTNANFDTPVYGFNLRAGAKTGEAGKLFATIGVARYKYDGYFSYYIPGYIVTQYYYGWDTDFVAGVGYQHKLSDNMHVSLQYQRYFDTEFNRGIVGLGFKF